MKEAVLNNQQWHLYMAFLLQVQFNFGIVCGIDAVLKGAPEAHHEAVGRGRAAAISEIKSICEAFNQTIAPKIGKEAEQVLVDHYSPAADLFERLRPEIEAAPVDFARLAYYVDLYRAILAKAIAPGYFH